MFLAVEGTLPHSDGFKTVAVTLHESAQKAITETFRERADATETTS